MVISDILIFGSYLAHRSGANTSSKDRRAIYATYNPATEADLHDEYYADREKFYPATHMRKESESYTEGQTRFAFATPMLTVDQLAYRSPKLIVVSVVVQGKCKKAKKPCYWK